jgi:hypothetical protein
MASFLRTAQTGKCRDAVRPNLRSNNVILVLDRLVKGHVRLPKRFNCRIEAFARAIVPGMPAIARSAPDRIVERTIF